MKNEDISQEILKALLPEGILDYFAIVQIIDDGKAFNIHLEEKNLHPIEYKDEKLLSKGFYDVVSVQDFPLRGKALYLHIKRRKWQVESNGKIVSRNWKIAAKGTRFTKEFASFLKGAFGLFTD